MTEQAAELCKVPLEKRIRILGCHVEQACEDGVEHIPEIIRYDHLGKAFEKARGEAGIDFQEKFFKREALLEAYTCYPVVPIAFLLATGLVQKVSEIPDFLKEYPLTLSGGLNLGKAPWNNTTLSHLITMVKQLRDPTQPSLGGIHSNGALGYLQGFVILKRV